MKVGVVTFPGSLDDDDARRAVTVGGHEAVALWHGDHDLRDVDAVILPGGFSYGDYLRCGAISRFAPVMTEVVEAAHRGMPVLGICNGFQILCESHLLPGALIRNDHRKFVCRDQRLRIENASTAWTNAYEQGQVLIARVDIPERTVLKEDMVEAMAVPRKFMEQDSFEVKTPSDPFFWRAAMPRWMNWRVLSSVCRPRMTSWFSSMLTSS